MALATKYFALIALWLCAIGSALFWLYVGRHGTSAVHEILGGIYLLITILCIAGIGVIAAIDHLASRAEKHLRQRETTAPQTDMRR